MDPFPDSLPKRLPLRFFDPGGREIVSATSRTMREIDRIAMEETGPNLYQMMENAGRSVASFILGRIFRTRSGGGRVLVMAGPGGNGGGGICAARHLANHGVRVSVALVEKDALKQVAREQLNVYRATQGEVVEPDGWTPGDFDLVVDALLGYSLKGPPTPPFEGMIRRAKKGKTPLLALDIPSGVDATTGETPGTFLPARWTITLALPKTGLSPKTAGRIYLADLGIPAETYRRAGIPNPPRFGPRYWFFLWCRRTSPIQPQGFPQK